MTALVLALFATTVTTTGHCPSPPFVGICSEGRVEWYDPASGCNGVLVTVASTIGREAIARCPTQRLIHRVGRNVKFWGRLQTAQPGPPRVHTLGLAGSAAKGERTAATTEERADRTALAASVKLAALLHSFEKRSHRLALRW